MKTKWLFPHRYRLAGWVFFVPCAVLGLATMYANYNLSWLVVNFLNEPFTINLGASTGHLVNIQNLTDEVAAVGVIVGLLLIAFSREKVEDEMIGQLRLEALQWSVYVNYIILAIAILTMYDGAFFNMMVYNMFTILLVFIIRFRWLLYQNSQTLLVL